MLRTPRDQRNLTSFVAVLFATALAAGCASTSPGPANATSVLAPASPATGTATVNGIFDARTGAGPADWDGVITFVNGN